MRVRDLAVRALQIVAPYYATVVELEVQVPINEIPPHSIRHEGIGIIQREATDAVSGKEILRELLE